MAHEQRTRWEREGVGEGEGMRCEGVGQVQSDSITC